MTKSSVSPILTLEGVAHSRVIKNGSTLGWVGYADALLSSDKGPRYSKLEYCVLNLQEGVTYRCEVFETDYPEGTAVKSLPRDVVTADGVEFVSPARTVPRMRVPADQRMTLWNQLSLWTDGLMVSTTHIRTPLKEGRIYRVVVRALAPAADAGSAAPVKSA